MAFLLVSLIIIFDQLSKLLILRYFAIGQELTIIESFFSLLHIRNSGAAWGILSDRTWGIVILTAVSLIASCAIVYLMKRHADKTARIFLALILGGSIGNLIDRVRLGNVVDFLHFKFGSYHFPTFNIADSAIVIGAVLLVIYLFRHPHLLDDVGSNRRKTNSGSDTAEIPPESNQEGPTLEP